MTWQPIKTAPMDGTKLWAYNPDNDGTSACYSCFYDRPCLYPDGAFIAASVGDTDYFAEPTHWMPLPEPPKDTP